MMVHMAFITPEGGKCLRSNEHALFQPKELGSRDNKPLLLLCMTGAVSRMFMHHWNHTIDWHHGSFWNDVIVYDMKAVALLIAGYVCLCLPVAWLACFIVVHVCLEDQQLLGAWPDKNDSIIIIQNIAVSIISLVMWIFVWRWMLRHHYFSHIENNFAFNANSQITSYFKQHRLYSMKHYSEQVPSVTLVRMFLEIHKLTLTMLCYHVPLDPTILISTACEAIDTLRGKKNSTTFANVILCVATSSTGHHMAIIQDFFIKSGFNAVLTPDSRLLMCTWASSMVQITPAPVVLSVYYTLLPFEISFCHPTTSAVVVVEEEEPHGCRNHHHLLSLIDCGGEQSSCYFYQLKHNKKKNNPTQQHKQQLKFTKWLAMRFRTMSSSHPYYCTFDDYLHNVSLS